MKVCLVCGEKIAFESRAKKYCSEACRKRVKYAKDRAWLKARPGKAVEYSRKWRARNPELVRQTGRDAYRRKCLSQINQERNS